jgi:hypothetical protein
VARCRDQRPAARRARRFTRDRDGRAWRDAAVFGEQRDYLERAAGKITSAGLYTAPASMTATGTDTVTATGPGGSGTATVTLVPPTGGFAGDRDRHARRDQQFSASNATGWSAAAGSITSAGLYTAPASMTASGTDTVTATGPGGTGTAIVTLRTIRRRRSSR